MNLSNFTYGPRAEGPRPMIGIRSLSICMYGFFRKAHGKSPVHSLFSPNQNPSGSRDRSSKKATLSMANSMISLDKVKAFWQAQVHDDEKWAYNMKLMRAAGLFGGSIFLMRQFGDLMAV